jgi:virginiamycin B lyase
MRWAWRLVVAGAAAVGAWGAITAPAALAAASPHLYWTDFVAGTIGQADLPGTNVNTGFMKPPQRAYSVAVDGHYIYWTDANFGPAIGRANLDGTNANPNFITGASTPQGIAVGGQHIYWTNAASGTIGRANLDGTQVNETFIAGSVADGSALAVDGQHLNWTNQSGGTIGRANLDGSGVNQSFISGAHTPNGVAVDGHYIYWTNQSGGTIGRASLDGSGVKQSFIGGLSSNPTAIAVDSQRIYWTSVSGKIAEADLDGSNINPDVVNINSVDVLGIAVSVPVAQVTPAAPTPFQPANIGKPSVPQFLTLTNTGQQALSWSDLTLTGADPGDFIASPTTCPPSLAPGVSCQVLVSFIPQAVGTRSATLQITTNDIANGPIEVALSGTGTGSPGISHSTGSTGPGTAAQPPVPPQAAAETQIVTCRTISTRHPRHTRRACTARTVPATTRLAVHGRTTATIRITRGRAVYATGTAVLPARGPWQLLVTDLRPIRSGAYTLILSRSSHGRRTTTRQSITVR